MKKTDKWEFHCSLEERLGKIAVKNNIGFVSVLSIWNFRKKTLMQNHFTDANPNLGICKDYARNILGLRKSFQKGCSFYEYSIAFYVFVYVTGWAFLHVRELVKLIR